MSTNPPPAFATAAAPSSSFSSSRPAQTTSPLPSPEQNTPITTAAPPSSTTTTSLSASPSASTYQAFHTYPFATDAEFKLGLGVILGKPAGTPATEDETRGIRMGGVGDRDGDGDGDEYAALGGELLLKAKMFYFAKKFPSTTTTTSLTPKGYITYLQQLKNNPNSPSASSAFPPQALPSSALPSSTPPPPSTTATTTTAPPQPHKEPAYPTPFANIVNLITNNQPIPGIQEIPDTVLTGKDKPSVAARRRKPWEVATAANVAKAPDTPDGGADGGSTSIEG
ncbi:hypothetical protein ACJ73_10150, partial [Blastomyces percursus]